MLRICDKYITYLKLILIVSFFMLISNNLIYSNAYNTIFEFDGTNSGDSPSQPPIYYNGKFYGTTYAGGAYSSGVIYSVNIDGSNFTVLKDMDVNDGTYLTSKLYLIGTTLYGVASVGGANNEGTLFKIQIDGSGFAVLHDFDYTNDGSSPVNGLAYDGTYFYGACFGGGINGLGTAWKALPSGANFTKLVDFDANGGNPYGRPYVSSGVIYITLSSGGDNTDGSIYSLNTDGSNLQALHMFSSPFGSFPFGALIEINHQLWGITSSGGTYNGGVIFKLDKDGNNYTVVRELKVNANDAADPYYCELTNVGDFVYTTSYDGGSKMYGALISIKTDGSAYNILQDFDLPDGVSPYSSPIVVGNKLYGVTTGGGTNYNGTIYSYDLNYNIPTVSSTTASNITSTSVDVTGIITSDGNLTVSENGFVIGSSSEATTTSYLQKHSISTGIGAISSTFTGLTSGNTYYVRAYAINSFGTAYGGEATFTTLNGQIIISTNAITGITINTANSGGNITNDGGLVITTRGIIFGTTNNPELSGTSTTTSDGSGTGIYTSNMGGLSPGTTYYVKAYATNSNGTYYGSEISFSTLADYATLNTTVANSIGTTTASSGANITSDGGALVTVRGVVWDLSNNPTVALGTKTSDGTGTGSFVSSLTGLTPGVTYYLRSFATNSVGTAYGNEISFSTLADYATISTNAVSAITGFAANTGGNVTSDGGASITDRGVVYSTMPNPTLLDTQAPTIGTTGTYIINLSSLIPGTTYFVRAYAINATGVAYGNDVSFTTLDYPVITTTSESSLTGVSAISGGNATSDGNDPITAKGVVWSLTSGATIGTHLGITTDGTGLGMFSSNITGLSYNTTYFVRAYVTNSVGTTYGNEISFLTNSSSVVQTEDVFYLNASSAFGSGKVIDDGGVAVTSSGIVWASTPNPTIGNNDTLKLSSGVNYYSGTITNLAPGNKYYVRAFAINADGVSYGLQKVIYLPDLDGISTEEEAGAPNSGDGNNDGLPDYSQKNVVSLINIKGNYTTIASQRGYSLVNAKTMETTDKSNYSYPLGIYEFKLSAQRDTIVLYFHSEYSLNKYVYRKQNAQGKWFNYDKATFGTTTIAGKQVATVTIVLEDGEAGDADGLLNGVIYDPGGPAILISVLNIPVFNDYIRYFIILTFLSLGLHKIKKTTLQIF